MPFKGIRIKDYLPNADLGRLSANMQASPGASESGQRAGLARLRMIEDREEADRDRQFQEKEKAQAIITKVRQDHFASTVEQYKKSSDPMERSKLRVGIALQMRNLGVTDTAEMDNILKDLDATPLQKTPEEERDFEVETARLKEAAKQGEKPKDTFQGVPASALTNLFKSSTPESIRKSIKTGKLDDLEFDDDAEKDIRVIGGMIVDVTDMSNPNVLLDTRAGKLGNNQLEKAEITLEQARENLKKNPNSKEAKEKLNRAEAFVKKVATGKAQVEGDFAAVDQAAREMIADVKSILLDAEKESETVTGVVGAAKAKFGGLARQLGYPVGLRSEMLRRRLQTLQTQIGPPLLQDSRLSNQERERVQDIVGDVDIWKDDLSVMQAMDDITSILDRLNALSRGVDAGDEDGSSKPGSDQNRARSLTNEELLAKSRERLNARRSSQ